MKRTSFAIPVVLAIVMSTAGCGKTDKPAAYDDKTPQSAGISEKQITASTDQASAEKLNAYTQGYNIMMRGAGGVSATYKQMQKFADWAKVEDNLILPVMSDLSGALDSFNKGLAISGGRVDDLDMAVKPVVEAGEKLLAQQKELEPYFKSKAYKDDHLAKGKAAFPEMLANYEAIIAGMDKVDMLLTGYQRVNVEKRLAEFKKKGDMLRFHTEESMLLAQDLLGVFKDPEKSVKSAESYVKADEIVARLEASLKAQRKAIDKEKGKGAHVGMYESINGNLMGLIESYHDLRQKKTGYAYNNMTKRYNYAVDSYNRATRLGRSS